MVHVLLSSKASDCYVRRSSESTPPAATVGGPQVYIGLFGAVVQRDMMMA